MGYEGTMVFSNGRILAVKFIGDDRGVWDHKLVDVTEDVAKALGEYLKCSQS